MTDFDRNEAIFDAILATTWATMQEHDLDSCITGSRIAFDICREQGISVKAVNTQVRVYNPPMSERIERGERPADTAEVERWEKEDGSWNVGIGGFGYDQPERFDGHLVVLADGIVLLDPTLPQANRPEHGIELNPTAVTIEPGWPEDDRAVGGKLRGCLIMYAPQEDDRRWVATESWAKRELREPVLRIVREAVDSALANL